MEGEACFSCLVKYLEDIVTLPKLSPEFIHLIAIYPFSLLLILYRVTGSLETIPGDKAGDVLA